MGSRSEYNSGQEEEHNDGIGEIFPYLSPIKPEKVVVADMDSLIYWTLYEKNEDGSRKELDEAHLEFLQGKLNELVLKILNKIETYITIKRLYIYIRGSKNFRKELFPSYKSGRPERHILTDRLYEYMESHFGALKADFAESEDYCYSIAKTLNWDCVILYCDHDLEEIHTSILYNFQKDRFKVFTPEQALHNKYRKLIEGEPGDSSNFSKGIGRKHFEASYKLGMSEEEYEEQALKSFIKVHKTGEKAKEMLSLAKQIIWLKDINELKTTENESSTGISEEIQEKQSRSQKETS